MRLHVLALALALPVSALAQPAISAGNPMTQPVTPRDVPWYMNHSAVMEQTLRACHSNAAYAPLADCENAEAAGAGLMRRRYHAAATNLPPALDLKNPAHWDANPIARDGILAQCRNNGPGDQFVMPYCAAAAASALHQIRSGG